MCCSSAIRDHIATRAPTLPPPSPASCAGEVVGTQSLAEGASKDVDKKSLNAGLEECKDEEMKSLDEGVELRLFSEGYEVFLVGVEVTSPCAGNETLDDGNDEFGDGKYEDGVGEKSDEVFL